MKRTILTPDQKYEYYNQVRKSKFRYELLMYMLFANLVALTWPNILAVVGIYLIHLLMMKVV